MEVLKKTEVEVLNIQNTVCLPIYKDKISECISMQKSSEGFLNNITFNLDTVNPNYVAGKPIFIKKIDMSYDFIGLAASTVTNTQIAINGQTLTLTPTILYDASITPDVQVYLFNELDGNIFIQLSSYCETEIESEIKLITSERDRAFQVSNLKIVASGLIGGHSFTATADTSNLLTGGTNLISLSTFHIPVITFNGKINWPRIILKEKINANLILNNITLTSNCINPSVSGNPGSFMANVGVVFNINKQIYTSHKGPVAIFTRSSTKL